MLLACQEHLDRALDNFTEKYHEPPEMFLMSQVIDEDLSDMPQVCHYCGREAVYVVKKYAD
ncbi:MAG: CxxH/CxxC protein [Bacillota bacterium]|uniref:CxxH/CxxC protein n=1 Tax=Thermanaerosceptrum fracticalcis TaxID=1712410 RepID=A0A7G6E4W8_THEFR|nr:CxxH/CxxC protein [Thermanaerosceptrum fracticalcis]QNB47122.1 CxxH/CxxC protein [Thermanaerosceptrum fracticalcis]